MAMLPNGVMIGRLLVAAVLGGMVDFERERLLWAAGLRTHMLVCIGSCLICIGSADGFSDVFGEKNVVLDPSRIAAPVVSGVGFLGAGTILFRGEAVKGLTTAASLWAVAGIGLAAGSGLDVAAMAGTSRWPFWPGSSPSRNATDVACRPAVWPCWLHGVSAPSTS